jgi:hypothetical protein
MTTIQATETKLVLKSSYEGMLQLLAMWAFLHSYTLKSMKFLMLDLFPFSYEMAGGHTNTSSFQIFVFILEYQMLTNVPEH